MKFQTHSFWLPLAACLLFLVSSLRSEEPPVSAAGFALLELTQPRGLFVWSAAKRVAAADDPALRKVAQQLWRARRKSTLTGAEPLVVEGLAERDLPGTVEAMITLMRDDSGEQQVDSPGIGLDNDAANLWCRLAGRDWKRARALLAKLPGNDAALRFWCVAASECVLPLDRLPSFMEAMSRGVSEKSRERALYPALWNAVKLHGAQKTAASVARCAVRPMRSLAGKLVAGLKKHPPFNGVPPGEPRRQINFPGLERLLHLDVAAGEPRRLPFPLLAAVLQLSPEDALVMARGLAAEENAGGHWLGWMLFMRAAEGDPMAAWEVATETGNQVLRANHSDSIPYALQPGLELVPMIAKIRAMESPERQRQAMEGLLMSRLAQEFLIGEQGNPFMGLANEARLPAAYWRPGLCLAATAGGGRAALGISRQLRWEPEIGRLMLREEILRAWALADFPSFLQFASTVTNPDELAPLERARSFAGSLLERPQAAGADKPAQ